MLLPSRGRINDRQTRLRRSLGTVPENSLPQQDLQKPERVKGTVPFSLRKACAKIGTVPDRWYIFSWDLPWRAGSTGHC